MFTENTVWKAVERLINANVDLDSAGLSPYESGYVNGYNDALVNLLNALNIEHDFHHFDWLCCGRSERSSHFEASAAVIGFSNRWQVLFLWREPILLYYGILYLRVNKKGCSDGDEFCGRAR